MEEEKKSTNNDANKLDWRLVARAYSILIALVTDRLVKKEHLKLLNDIVAEAQTVDMTLIEYPCPQNMYRCMMRQINRIITDRLVDYTLDNATKAETDEMFGLCEIRNALDGINVREFDYVLTTIISKSGDLIPDKLRAYRLALAVAAPNSANAIIADIEMRCGSPYIGPQYGAPMSQPPMQQPWLYQPVNRFSQSVNPFYQQNMYNNQYRNGNPFQDGPSRPFTPNNGAGFGDMSDVLGGDNGKKK